MYRNIIRWYNVSTLTQNLGNTYDIEEEGSVHDLERVVNVLIKNEDVRKDRLTMIVSCFINFICNGLVDIVTYNNVFPN